MTESEDDLIIRRIVSDAAPLVRYALLGSLPDLGRRIAEFLTLPLVARLTVLQEQSVGDADFVKIVRQAIDIRHPQDHIVEMIRAHLPRDPRDHSEHDFLRPWFSLHNDSLRSAWSLTLKAPSSVAVELAARLPVTESDSPEFLSLEPSFLKSLPTSVLTILLSRLDFRETFGAGAFCEDIFLHASLNGDGRELVSAAAGGMRGLNDSQMHFVLTNHPGRLSLLTRSTLSLAHLRAAEHYLEKQRSSDSSESVDSEDFGRAFDGRRRRLAESALKEELRAVQIYNLAADLVYTAASTEPAPRSHPTDLLACVFRNDRFATYLNLKERWRAEWAEHLRQVSTPPRSRVEHLMERAVSIDGRLGAIEARIANAEIHFRQFPWWVAPPFLPP